jgi:hypothetical protein
LSWLAALYRAQQYFSRKPCSGVKNPNPYFKFKIWSFLNILIEQEVAHVSSKITIAKSFNGIANFLGVIGVIGSLIFVGLELR